MLVGRRHDLVLGTDPESTEDDVATVGRARRQRDLRRLGTDEAGDALTQPLPQLHHACEVRTPAAAVTAVTVELRADRIVRGAGDRPEGAGIEIGELLEHRELRPCLLEGHAFPLTRSCHACQDATGSRSESKRRSPSL